MRWVLGRAFIQLDAFSSARHRFARHSSYDLDWRCWSVLLLDHTIPAGFLTWSLRACLSPDTRTFSFFPFVLCTSAYSTYLYLLRSVHVHISSTAQACYNL